jgi:AP2 domain
MEASRWQDDFYTQDPDRLNAWKLWKKENRTKEITNDPEVVPKGIGIKYLQRIKDKKSEIALRKRLRLERQSIRENNPPKRPRPVKENPILRVDNTTGFRGVYRVRNKFRAQIGFDGRKQKLGYFNTAEEAARAYDDAARENLGPSAQVNFPLESRTQSGSLPDRPV